MEQRLPKEFLSCYLWGSSVGRFKIILKKTPSRISIGISANCLTTRTKVQGRNCSKAPGCPQTREKKCKSIKASGKTGPIGWFKPHPLRCFVSKSACSLKPGGQCFGRTDNVLGATVLTCEECWETTWHRETKLKIVWNEEVPFEPRRCDRQC